MRQQSMITIGAVVKVSTDECWLVAGAENIERYEGNPEYQVSDVEYIRTHHLVHRTIAKNLQGVWSIMTHKEAERQERFLRDKALMERHGKKIPQWQEEVFKGTPNALRTGGLVKKEG